jgi:hypothetical protein
MTPIRRKVAAMETTAVLERTTRLTAMAASPGGIEGTEPDL